MKVSARSKKEGSRNSQENNGGHSPTYRKQPVNIGLPVGNTGPIPAQADCPAPVGAAWFSHYQAIVKCGDSGSSALCVMPRLQGLDVAEESEFQ